MTGEGLELRTRWARREFIPFDEVRSLIDDRLVLVSGQGYTLDASQRGAAAVALSPPPPGGSPAQDASPFKAYVEGDWSPVRAANTLLSMAARWGATDLHLEAGPQGYRIRARLVGDMVDFSTLPGDRGRRLVAALKHLAGCQPYRADIVQEGRIPREGVAADVRASFMPTVLGERVALRLFGRLLSLGELGLEPGVRQAFETALDTSPSGLLLVAGPSGAGKTTTLYAALLYLAKRRGGAHLSLEDPVEQRLRLAGVDVDQVELDPERGLTAEVALAGALRQDVDLLSVGEIRTPAEAELALRAAHTGRLVLAGIHAGSAAEAVQRMLDLGADPGVLDLTLRAVLHQRLRTVACDACEGLACPRCQGHGRKRVLNAMFDVHPEGP